MRTTGKYFTSLTLRKLFAASGWYLLLYLDKLCPPHSNCIAVLEKSIREYFLDSIYKHVEYRAMNKMRARCAYCLWP